MDNLKIKLFVEANLWFSSPNQNYSPQRFTLAKFCELSSCTTTCSGSSLAFRFAISCSPYCSETIEPRASAESPEQAVPFGPTARNKFFCYSNFLSQFNAPIDTHHIAALFVLLVELQNIVLPQEKRLRLRRWISFCFFFVHSGWLWYVRLKIQNWTGDFGAVRVLVYNSNVKQGTMTASRLGIILIEPESEWNSSKISFHFFNHYLHCVEFVQQYNIFEKEHQTTWQCMCLVSCLNLKSTKWLMNIQTLNDEIHRLIEGK